LCQLNHTELIVIPTGGGPLLPAGAEGPAVCPQRKDPSGMQDHGSFDYVRGLRPHSAQDDNQ
jgi:hypothetical protein